MAKDQKFVEVANREEWRAWLQDNYTQDESILLVTYRKGTSEQYIPTPEIVEEALCFGWIDSTRRSIDERRSTLLISPRRARSKWSAVNKARVEKLIADGRMTPAGLAVIERAKANGTWDSDDEAMSEIVPDDLAEGLAAAPVALRNFEAFPASLRKMKVRWVREAKRPETRARRIGRVVDEAIRNDRTS